MNKIPFNIKNANLEILAKIIEASAKHYECHVHYVADHNRLEFQGDNQCCRYIMEQVLALFPEADIPDQLFKGPED